MANLYITEYAALLAVPNGQDAQIPLEPPVAEQVVDYSGGVASSSAFNANTSIVRIKTDAICSVLFGTAPTATTSSGRLAAEDTEWRGVPAGQSFKVSVISNT